jgi:hypothetical protein
VVFSNFEKAIIYKLKILFEHLPHNAFLVHVLQGKSCCTCELKMPNSVVGPNHLSKKLLLQMDNCVKDNKINILLTFMSLLTTREVFKEIKLGFFVVGHTHENFDDYFGYLSKS